MYPIRVLCLSAVVGIFTTCIAFAHPGRTDSNGGHYNRSTGEYHYHNSGSSSKSSYSAPAYSPQPSALSPQNNSSSSESTTKITAPVAKNEEPPVVKDLDYYRRMIATKEKGETHVLLSDGSICDVLNDECAMTVVWANDWREAIGGSLNSADLEEKIPVIYLVLRDKGDLKHLTQSQKLIKQYGLPIKVRGYQAE